MPVFCSEIFTATTRATFTVSPGYALTINIDVPAATYWRGNTAGSLAAVVVAALNNASAINLLTDVWSYAPTALSQNLGVAYQLRVANASANRTVTATNAAAQAVLWSLGFRAATAVTLTGNITSRTVATTGIPYGTWWPKAHNTITERWTPVEVQAYSSPLPGAGSVLASVRQEPTTQGRWWRTWRILPIDAARCSVRRAVSTTTPQWAAIAGLTTNPGDAALDNPDWWWSRTLDGSRRFIAIENEAALISGTVRWGEYRFAIGERGQPVSMDEWRRLGNVTQYGPAGSTQQMEISALWTGAGNL